MVALPHSEPNRASAELAGARKTRVHERRADASAVQTGFHVDADDFDRRRPMHALRRLAPLKLRVAGCDFVDVDDEKVRIRVSEFALLYLDREMRVEVVANIFRFVVGLERL